MNYTYICGKNCYFGSEQVSMDKSAKQIQDEKEIMARRIESHIAFLENRKYDQKFKIELRDKLKFPEWDKKGWTKQIDINIQRLWHYLDHIGKLSVYLTILNINNKA